ncbi:MAG: shikimate dehydrogenase [Odoribacter sp.]
MQCVSSAFSSSGALNPSDGKWRKRHKMKTYGIIGMPLAHSCSPAYFNEKFKREGIEAEYLRFEWQEIGELPALLERCPTLKGLNVTIPYKQHILPFLDEISPEATAIGAVNCVKVTTRRGKPYLIGYNTDMDGFRKAVAAFIPSSLSKALILGNGGAAKAVRYALCSLGVETLTVSRHPQTPTTIGYPDLPPLLADHRLLVNTTPLGTFPHPAACPDLPYALLSPDHYLFDLVYNPPLTEFMKRGIAAHAHACNGQQMWQEQADRSWEIWQQD